MSRILTMWVLLCGKARLSWQSGFSGTHPLDSGTMFQSWSWAVEQVHSGKANHSGLARDEGYISTAEVHIILCHYVTAVGLGMSRNILKPEAALVVHAHECIADVYSVM